MKNKLLALFMALLMTLSFAGCLVKEDSDKTDPTAAPAATAKTSDGTSEYDPEAIAIELGDVKITVEEVANVFSSYISMFSYSGSVDENTIEQCREMAVQALIDYYMPIWKAAQTGVTLTAEEEAKIAADAEVDLETERDELICQFAYYAGATEDVAEDVAQLSEEEKEAALALIADELEGAYHEGYTFDDYLAYELENLKTSLRIDALSDKLREQAVQDTAVTDEQIETWYADTLAAQKESFDKSATAYRELAEAYREDHTNNPVLYVPEGILRTQVIEIVPSGERDLKIETNRSDMAKLEQEYGNLALNGEKPERQAEILNEYAALKAENVTLEEAFLGAARLAINAAYEALEEETPFEDVMKRYNADGSVAETLLIDGEDPVYGELGTFAAELLVDTYSEPLPIGDAYYIVKLLGKVPAGEIDRTAIADEIRAAATRSVSSAAWEELQQEWNAEAEMAAVRHTDAYEMIGEGYFD